ncbi:hypothetical protein QW180_29320 [Vibrio sinaloensis]|nr:hypothetical protein [Vibrio sinaloensis]
MNGEVTIESQLDKGTRISATLPLDIAITERSVEPNNMIVEPHNLFDETLEVLLVEDNHTNAFIAKAFCEKVRNGRDLGARWHQCYRVFKRQPKCIVSLDG